MPEPITTQLVGDVLTDLLEAFPPYRGKESFNVIRKATIYRDGLIGLSGESLRAAAKVAIRQDDKFPKVARLRQLALEWSRRSNAMLTQATRYERDDPCPVCGAVPKPHGQRDEIIHDARKHGAYVSSGEDT